MLTTRSGNRRSSHRRITLHLSPTSLGSSNSIVKYVHPILDDELAAIGQHWRATLIVRACGAYLRSRAWLVDRGLTPSERYSCICGDDQTRRTYVCLGDEVGRLLAVYRVDRRWKLKRLRRFPTGITE